MPWVPSPSSSVKIQIMDGKVCLRCDCKTLLGDVNKLFVFKLPQGNFPANDLNFYWRWRWWVRIQAIFLNLFDFNSWCCWQLAQTHTLNTCTRLKAALHGFLHPQALKSTIRSTMIFIVGPCLVMGSKCRITLTRNFFFLRILPTGWVHKCAL